MQTIPRIMLVLLVTTLAACSVEETAERPDPQTLTREAIGYFCGMIVADHAGPKGQVILRGKPAALWFSSVRDTLAFTRLPEETTLVGAVYVTDLSRASDWSHSGDEAWIDIHEAIYVVGGRRRGGMGAPEVAPFSIRSDAETFASHFGGALMSLDEIPDDALLGTWENENSDHAYDGGTP
jgi:copper chaperone NosL